jgi:hypothetical protein
MFSKALKCFSSRENIHDVFTKYSNNRFINADHPGACGRFLRQSLHDTEGQEAEQLLDFMFSRW